MFKKKILISVLAGSTACLSFAKDNGLTYTYVGVGHLIGEVFDVDFAGFGISGSAAINASIFVIGQYSSLTSDDEFDLGFGADDIEVTQINFGLGFHTPIATNVDLVASLSYVDVKIESFGITEDGNGYLVNAGVRGKPTDVLEFGASINYADIEDEGETSYGISARYFAAPQTSLGLGYESADDVDTISFDLRVDI